MTSILTMTRFTRLKFCSAIGLICLASQAMATAPASKPAAPNTSSAAPQTKQWETDAAVRQGMGNILQIMRPEQENIDSKRLSTADYQRLGKALDQEISNFLDKRKLSKEAEKSFHLVVMLDLTHGVELMRLSPKIDLQRVAAQGVMQTLHHYSEYFQHPGWPVNATPAR
jgi:Skp family chaperone for outer membrane proteins